MCWEVDSCTDGLVAHCDMLHTKPLTLGVGHTPHTVAGTSRMAIVTGSGGTLGVYDGLYMAGLAFEGGRDPSSRILQ